MLKLIEKRLYKVKKGQTIKSLSAELSERILSDREKGIKNPYAADERRVIRRDSGRDKANVIRTAYIRDIDKIIHCPYYSR